MNRTHAGWRTWYTVPLPNIGMLLLHLYHKIFSNISNFYFSFTGIMYVRANKKSVKMFKDAWDEYKVEVLSYYEIDEIIFLLSLL